MKIGAQRNTRYLVSVIHNWSSVPIAPSPNPLPRGGEGSGRDPVLFPRPLGGEGQGEGVHLNRPRFAISLNTYKPRGFTLIEIMVVVVVIGILAATIIPLFMGTTHDAKVSTAKSNIAEIESALERCYIHLDRRPTSEEGLKTLVEAPAGEEKKWRGPYVKMLRADPWGNPYQYRSPGLHHPSSFDLWSRGADAADGGEGEGADIGNW